MLIRTVLSWWLLIRVSRHTVPE